MARTSDEDLFKDSTMSFGEHLDELRSALFKSVLAITLGFFIGLWAGNWVVARLQDPLKKALEKYYIDQAEADFMARIAEREKLGEVVPPELKDPNYVRQLVQQDRMLFEESFIDPANLLEGLQAKYPKEKWNSTSWLN